MLSAEDKCITCANNNIDVYLELYNCKHQPFCTPCTETYFNVHQKTECPLCRKQVADNIIYSGGFLSITGNVQGIRCIVCHADGYSAQWIRCICGCECRICNDCESDYEGRDYSKFCFCKNYSKSQSPYNPPAHIQKEKKDQSGESNKNIELSNNINLENIVHDTDEIDANKKEIIKKENDKNESNGSKHIGKKNNNNKANESNVEENEYLKNITERNENFELINDKKI